MKTDQIIEIGGKYDRLIRLPGRGKGGYSWLADSGGSSSSDFVERNDFNYEENDRSFSRFPADA